MSVLKLSLSAVAHGEPAGTTIPRRRFFDWLRAIEVTDARAPLTSSIVLSEQGDSQTVFNSLLPIGFGVDTEIAVSIQPESIYRLTHTGGDPPGWLVDRSITVDGIEVEVVVNANDTVTLTFDGGDVDAIVAGDVVWISDEIAQVFAVLNQGFWRVLSASGGVLVLARPADAGFSGTGETVTITDPLQFRAWSPAGMRVGDQVLLSDGFAGVNQGIFPVTGLTPDWIEVFSSQALSPETVIPGADAFQAFRSSKRWIQVESDQPVAVQVNGDTTLLNRLQPWVAGDAEKTAVYSRTGPTWALSIVNLSTVEANVTILGVE